MDEFFTNLGSLYWWISVVAVGILINVFSNYLQKNLDKIFIGLSSRRKAKSEKEQAKRQEYIELLKNNPDELAYWQYSALFIMLLGVLAALVSTIMIVAALALASTFKDNPSVAFSDYVVFFGSALFIVALLVLSASLYNKAIRIASLIHEARTGEDKSPYLWKV